MKRTMKCEFKGLIRVPGRHKYPRYRAHIRRLDPHPRLGPPTGGVTITSEVKTITFDARVMVTENNIYFWD